MCTHHCDRCIWHSYHDSHLNRVRQAKLFTFVDREGTLSNVNEKYWEYLQSVSSIWAILLHVRAPQSVVSTDTLNINTLPFHFIGLLSAFISPWQWWHHHQQSLRIMLVFWASWLPSFTASWRVESSAHLNSTDLTLRIVLRPAYHPWITVLSSFKTITLDMGYHLSPNVTCYDMITVHVHQVINIKLAYTQVCAMAPVGSHRNIHLPSFDITVHQFCRQ